MTQANPKVTVFWQCFSCFLRSFHLREGKAQTARALTHSAGRKTQLSEIQEIC
jgi:hypothetical protein